MRPPPPPLDCFSATASVLSPTSTPLSPLLLFYCNQESHLLGFIFLLGRCLGQQQLWLLRHPLQSLLLPLPSQFRSNWMLFYIHCRDCPLVKLQPTKDLLKLRSVWIDFLIWCSQPMPLSSLLIVLCLILSPPLFLLKLCQCLHIHWTLFLISRCQILHLYQYLQGVRCSQYRQYPHKLFLHNIQRDLCSQQKLHLMFLPILHTLLKNRCWISQCNFLLMKRSQSTS